MKLYKMLGHMSYEVAAIQGVRDGANERAASCAKNDPCASDCRVVNARRTRCARRSWRPKKAERSPAKNASASMWDELYGDVTQYEGRPTDLPGGAGGLARS